MQPPPARPLPGRPRSARLGGGACGLAARRGGGHGGAAQVAEPAAPGPPSCPPPRAESTRPGRLFPPSPSPSLSLPSRPRCQGRSRPPGPRGEFAPLEFGEEVGGKFGEAPGGGGGGLFPPGRVCGSPPFPSRALARFPRPSSSSLGGFFSAQLRVEPLRAVPLPRVSFFPFILWLLFIFILFLRVLSRSCSPPLLSPGPGALPPLPARGWRPRSPMGGRARSVPECAPGHTHTQPARTSSLFKLLIP